MLSLRFFLRRCRLAAVVAFFARAAAAALAPSASRRARRGRGASPPPAGRDDLRSAARRPAPSGAPCASRRGTRGPSGPGGSASATGPGWRSTPSRTAGRRRRRSRPCCCALAIAERSTFSMSRATPLRANRSVASAWFTSRPRMRSSTSPPSAPRCGCTSRSRALRPLRTSPWRRRPPAPPAGADRPRPCRPWSCGP